MMKKTKRGFTLIELLVVVAIIAILSSVVAANVFGARVKTRDSKRVADIASIQGALELYHAENGKYPSGPVSSSYNANCTDTGTNLVNTNNGLKTDLVPSYISTFPSDPVATNKVYAYCSYTSSDAQKYVIGAQLEDRGNNLPTDSFTASFTLLNSGRTVDCTGGTTGTASVHRNYCQAKQ